MFVPVPAAMAVRAPWKPRPAVRLTRAGGGDGGYNFDLTLADGEGLEARVGQLTALMRELRVGPSTYFGVYPSGWKPSPPARDRVST